MVVHVASVPRAARHEPSGHFSKTRMKRSAEGNETHRRRFSSRRTSMSPVPILMAFLLSMVLFGVWAFFAVRDSMARDLTVLRAQPVVHTAVVGPAAAIEDLSERPLVLHDQERVPWKRRMLIHAVSLAIGVLLLLGLAVNGERAPSFAGE
jgi:hypothetical protein